MEPAPQLNPIQQPQGLPYAEPPRPINLQPNPRLPLDLKPIPRRPIDVKPDPNLSYGENVARGIGQALRNPLQGLEPILNNPIATPGKPLLVPLALADRTRDLHQDLNSSEPIRTLDVPAIPLPVDEFDDLPISPTERMPPNAARGGEVSIPGQPGQPGVPGGLAGVIYIIEDIDTRDPTVAKFRDRAPGPISGYFWERRFGTEAVPYYLAGDPPQKFYGSRADGYPFDFIGWDTRQFHFTVVRREDGQPEPDQSPAVPPVFLPNPAREALGPPQQLQPPTVPARPQIDPNPAPRLNPPGQPGGDITPWKPPVIDITPTLRPRPPQTAPEPQKLPLPNPVPPLLPPAQQTPTDTLPPANPGPTSRETTKAPPLPTLPPVTPPRREDDCCAVPEVQRTSRQLERLLKEILDKLDDCNLCEEEIKVPRWKCEEVNGQPTPVLEEKYAEGVPDALELIAAEIGAIRQRLGVCDDDENNVAPRLLATGRAMLGDEVAYVPIGPEVRQVELIITGSFPRDVRFYRLTQQGEAIAKFGALTVAYEGVTGGYSSNATHSWVWTRRTVLDTGETQGRTRFIRIFLQYDLSWALYDTGVR